jgi:hypothetical protein
VLFEGKPSAVEHVEDIRIRHQRRTFRYGIAATALAAGIACAGAPGVAWADSPDTGSAADTSSSADSGPSGAPASSDRVERGDRAADRDRVRPFWRRATTSDKPDGRIVDLPSRAKDALERVRDRTVRTVVDLPTRDTVADLTGRLPAIEPPPANSIPELPVVQPDSDHGTIEPPAGRDQLVLKRSEIVLNRAALREARQDLTTALPAPGELRNHIAHAARQFAASAAQPTVSAAPDLTVVSAASVEVTTPVAPQPLSPVAKLLELPGRFVNAILEALDFTSSAGSPTLPIGFGPINDLIFGAYRELERLLGLWETPPPQPATPTLVYDPTEEELNRKTPTVAQLLNAATAAYVLGSTPGDLQPFVVNGFQMQRTSLLTGMVGKAWVTPDGQIIIAYQGTTGGSHLLFNPLIVIPQIITDLLVVFTRSTPWAFHDALDFAQQVRAEAAKQGYSDDDIFVTGHSLGAWEAQYVAQQTGLAGVGFEAPGINTAVEGNGADSLFVNIGNWGSSVPFMSTDVPGLQPFMPPYVPGTEGGGSKPHYGPIVMIGDQAAATPLYNASTLWGKSITGSAVFLMAFLMNFFQYHLPGVQAYHLDVTSDPGVVPFLGTSRGTVHEGYGELTIPQLLLHASNDGILYTP